MGWIIALLAAVAIVQTVRLRDQKNDRLIDAEILHSKLRYIQILEDENRDYRQWFGRQKRVHQIPDNQKPN